ncbi:hypothetical protein IV38_GL000559 [Lactobacillus selangorensis]|uniref:Uncharacterized protein n=1 Tax=Lactobacillus selangorensis TaxID=81857 RepID=A0A0R2G8F6_9LACO|nr:hypothetical protein [Lactobacillus selangorensis]KRN29672.1 hypothetical protein IV38_GL000559 [Lactobacillus selangorensis]KRN33799.1 hypothetical protein IV40_GL000109 [Lactobacillus selangorensis]
MLFVNIMILFLTLALLIVLAQNLNLYLALVIDAVLVIGLYVLSGKMTGWFAPFNLVFLFLMVVTYGLAFLGRPKGKVKGTPMKKNGR